MTFAAPRLLFDEDMDVYIALAVAALAIAVVLPQLLSIFRSKDKTE